MAGSKKPSRSSTKQAKHVMDVHRPNKVAPSASSKPLIVGHETKVEDPMVNKETTMPDDSEEHKVEVKRTAPKVIAPLSNPESLSDQSETTDAPPAFPGDDAAAPIADSDKINETGPLDTDEGASDPSDVPADATPSVPTEDQPPEKPAEAKSESPRSKGSSIVDTVAGKAAEKKDKKAGKEAEEIKKRLAEMEKLVEEKKYHVHTSSTTKKERRTRWVALLLALLLLVAGYLIVDAQVIKNNLWLPYHFFKEEAPDKNTPVATDDAENSDVVKESNQDKADEQLYINKDFGFQFMVSPFGRTDNIQIVEVAEVSATGKAYTFGIDKFSGGFVTKDWTPRADADLSTVYGFTDYQACDKEAVEFKVVIHSEAGKCVMAQASPAKDSDTASVSVLVRVQLDAEKIAGLEFITTPFALAEYSQAGLEAQVGDDNFSVFTKRELIDFVKSVRAL